MKLIGATCVYNEEAMIPYVMPYVETMGYDKFVVFNDGCTDRTIDILKEYPFIEIRDAEKTNVDSFEDRKLNCMLKIFEDSWRMRYETGEDIWMSFTDFDEVIWSQRERSIKTKEYLDLMNQKGYNYLEQRMLHLTWDGEVRGDGLAHTWPGVRGSWWMQEGSKVTMIKVSDIATLNGYYGNHAMVVKPIPGAKMLNLGDTGDFNGFHFKYFDGSLRNKEVKLVGDPDISLKTVRDASFPLENYFLMKGFFVKKTPPNKRDVGEGLLVAN